MWQDQPVATARGLVTATNTGSRGRLPLVSWLRDGRVGLALDWVFRITPELLPRTGSPYTAELLAEVAELRRWRECPPPSASSGSDARICGIVPTETRAHAVSHLCMDLAQVVCPDMEVGINWLWHVPSLLCDDDFRGEPRVELVEWCIADFEAFAAAIAPNAAADGGGV